MEQIFNSKHLLKKRRRLRSDMTPQEIILWSRLRREQLGCKFRRQHSIGNYIVDFYCPKKKLIVELDGCQHKRDKDTKHDAKRTRYFESLEIKVLRFWNNEVNENLEGVVLKIEENLKTHPDLLLGKGERENKKTRNDRDDDCPGGSGSKTMWFKSRDLNRRGNILISTDLFLSFLLKKYI
jgi:very-short-patch-repair endonuclease